MEDTEDWRPRPGTGQSRSFRILAHLTGTEFSKCQPREGRTLLLVPSPDPGLAGACSGTLYQGSGLGWPSVCSWSMPASALSVQDPDEEHLKKSR